MLFVIEQKWTGRLDRVFSTVRSYLGGIAH